MPDFSPETLRRSVHDTLDEAYAAIPDGKNHAILVDATAGDSPASVRALYVQRIADGWQVALEGQLEEGQYQSGHHVSGKVVALKSW